jgi:hypothetical protein
LTFFLSKIFSEVSWQIHGTSCMAFRLNCNSICYTVFEGRYKNDLYIGESKTWISFSTAPNWIFILHWQHFSLVIYMTLLIRTVSACAFAVVVYNKEFPTISTLKGRGVIRGAHIY